MRHEEASGDSAASRPTTRHRNAKPFLNERSYSGIILVHWLRPIASVPPGLGRGPTADPGVLRGRERRENFVFILANRFGG